MIKQNAYRRLVAGFLTVAFCSLLHLASAPLNAAPATVSRADASDTPRAIEEESDGGTKAKKKSSLPIILGVVGVGAIVAAVLLMGKKDSKDSYDITGSWNFDFTATNTSKTWSWRMTFSGSKSSGNWVNPFTSVFPNTATGTYTVDGKTVSIIINLFDPRDLLLNGQFENKDRMSGTATLVDLLIGGVSVTRATWVANRAGASSSAPGSEAGVTRANQ